MKNLIYVIVVCLLVAGCEKPDTQAINKETITKRILNEPETILKTNLDQAAQLLAEVVQNQSVMTELAALSNEDRKFFSLSFADLLDDTKSAGQFMNLRQKFIEKCGSQLSKGEGNDLAGFLVKNDCYIYCPYPADFYPGGTTSFTLAAHPIDNDFENAGYRFEGGRMHKVTVNEKYADRYQVLLVMPRDDDNDDLAGVAEKEVQSSKGDPINEVRIGKVRCAAFCGGLFEGTLELRLVRGYPELNASTGEMKGSYSTVIPVNYPRDYAKAAINNWTAHSEGGWYFVNSIWDSNWRTLKTQQCILIYEYDKVKETSVSATVGYKQDDLSAAMTLTAKTTYSGELLGICEWDRDWFLATNRSPGIYDEVKDGWVVRKTCPVFKLTTPLRVLYY